MKCKIKWIDINGNRTPDDNEAIGNVYLTEDPKQERVPICADHAARVEHGQVKDAPLGTHFAVGYVIEKF